MLAFHLLLSLLKISDFFVNDLHGEHLSLLEEFGYFFFDVAHVLVDFIFFLAVLELLSHVN
jgi:hypothetical protein